VVASCGATACAYRLGGRWTAERLAGQREPYLRAQVRGPQVRRIDALRGDEPRLRAALGSAGNGTLMRALMGVPESPDV
jgi:hypothetical protein